MQMEAGVLGQPLLHVGVLVGAVIVQDQVDLQALGNLSVDGAQELQELLVAVPALSRQEMITRVSLVTGTHCAWRDTLRVRRDPNRRGG